MAIVKDLGYLAAGALYYSANSDVIKEFPHFVHDLMLGAKEKPKQPGFIYTDLHCHLNPEESIRTVVDEVSRKVDIIAVTKWPEGNTRHPLSLQRAIQKLEEEKVEYSQLGKCAIKVQAKNGPLYMVEAIEVYMRQNQGIVILGDDKEYKDNELNMDDAIKGCEDKGAIWFMDHPFSISIPQIGFRYPLREEMRQREEWFDKYGPIIEISNLQNTLWMYPSNFLATKMKQKYGLVGIANSDTHLNNREVGLSRTHFPEGLFDGRTDESLFRTLKNALSTENKDQIKIERAYSSIWSFGGNMIIPFLRRKLHLKKNKSIRRL